MQGPRAELWCVTVTVQHSSGYSQVPRTSQKVEGSMLVPCWGQRGVRLTPRVKATPESCPVRPRQRSPCLS